jgi:hypothetical protein
MSIILHLHKEGTRDETTDHEIAADSERDWPAPVVTDDLHLSVLREPDGEKRVLLRFANRRVLNHEGRPTSFMRVWMDPATGACHLRVNPKFFAPLADEPKRKKHKGEPAEEKAATAVDEGAKPKRKYKPLTDEQKAARKKKRDEKKLEKQKGATAVPAATGDGRLPLIRDEDFDDEDH